jgi:hypothetical protein
MKASQKTIHRCRHLRPDELAFPVEARVRSYLAVNCSNCHRAGGTADLGWDGRAGITLEETGLINGSAVNNGGDPANRLVVSGDLLHSIVLNCVAASNGFTRMPQLGSTELDEQAIALLTEWIEGALPTRQTYDDWRLLHFESLISPEGAPGADPDVDLRTNAEEQFAGTGLNDAHSFLYARLAFPASDVAITLDLPANRSVRIDRSPDLLNWSPWEAPGNQGLPLPGGPFTITGAAPGPRYFFRFQLQGN